MRGRYGEHAGDRGVGAMGAAEGVVDVGGGGAARARANSGSFFSSPAWKRRFSSSATSPAEPRRPRRRLAEPSSAKATGPPSSAEPLRTGRSVYFELRSPFGRPQCEQRRSRAPAAKSSRIVGSAASIRVCR